MSGVDDLVDFVRARLDEDSAVVREANTSPEMVTGIPRSYVQAPVALHIGRFADPARVLADIEAKRRLLTAVVSARHDYDHWHARPPADSEERAKVLAGMTARWSAWQFVLGQLAKPYVDHPGFREEWRQLV